MLALRYGHGMAAEDLIFKPIRIAIILAVHAIFFPLGGVGGLLFSPHGERFMLLTSSRRALCPTHLISPIEVIRRLLSG